MKKAILLLIAGMIGGGSTAFAKPKETYSLTPLQKQQIAWALKILKESKTLAEGEKQCLQLDQDILNILEEGGLIERDDYRVSVICIGS